MSSINEPSFLAYSFSFMEPHRKKLHGLMLAVGCQDLSAITVTQETLRNC